MQWDVYFYFHGLNPSCFLYYVYVLFLLKLVKFKNKIEDDVAYVAIRNSLDVHSCGFLAITLR